ncbi:hypothetical protein EMIHUDRAFT_256015 [Emiliania huxleyi CCMP1516]|uniref:Uncharacterized protein n=2 Tax=Emiliania huxleyi TaxID=2903 RepID=A0A0D3J0P7_EMIH1|nr:hypothetical protein EMIHUDRAFT_256015 [Emiliania huxleyi CCMP1516]EOD17082.1 hypothetical protein EMIHUDRAFT_256015 [Emiliania huxleyi CCMP1516]|eukprot:XP_005769511.1 hypothetical protein EMIHUDRAFT_256015 [Emiliania huxleyi CCMP1516]
MVLAEVSPSGDGGVAAGAETEGGGRSTLSWFAEQAATASHVPPRLSCRASPWAQQRSASWRLCTSLSACNDPGVPLEPSIGQLRNFSVPWVPGAVRDLCKLHASGRFGRTCVV